MVDDFGGLEQEQRGKRRWVFALSFNALFWAMVAVIFYVWLTQAGEVEVPSRIWSETIQIAAPQPGIIKTIHFRETEQFAPGQVLFELENKDLDDEIRGIGEKIKNLDAQIEQEQTALSRRLREYDVEDKIRKAQASLDAARYDLEVLKQDLRAASQTVQLAKQVLQRAEELFRKGALSRPRLEQYRNDLDGAMLKYEKARLALQAKLKEIEGLLNELDLAKRHKQDLMRATDDRVKQLLQQKAFLQTELKNKLSQRERLVYKAERGGFVATLLKREGESVNRGDVVLEITTGERIWVEAFFQPEDANLISIGHSLRVRYGEYTFPARVESVGLKAIPNPLVPGDALTPREFVVPVRLVFDHPDMAKKYGLRPGMQVETVITKQEGLLYRLGLKERTPTMQPAQTTGDDSATTEPVAR